MQSLREDWSKGGQNSRTFRRHIRGRLLRDALGVSGRKCSTGELETVLLGLLALETEEFEREDLLVGLHVTGRGGQSDEVMKRRRAWSTVRVPRPRKG